MVALTVRMKYQALAAGVITYRVPSQPIAAQPTAAPATTQMDAPANALTTMPNPMRARHASRPNPRFHWDSFCCTS